MYNTDLPNRADLPTSAQLRRSTILAAIGAALILVFVVLPSEYGIDPTGVGRSVGFTQMGEIKMQLAEEAAQDAANSAPAPTGSDPQLAARLDRIEAMIRDLAATIPATPPLQEAPVSERFFRQEEDTVPVPAEKPESAPAVAEQAPAAPEWTDEVSFSLAPGEGAEFKLVMEEGAEAEFHWTANGAVVNYDTHGDGGGNSISYEKGRAVPEQEGVIKAAFTGNHGWFWRNRTDDPVTVTLRTRGAYSELKRLI